MKNPIKSVIEISKFLFELSPSHQVTIGLKGSMPPKTVYNFKNMYFNHNPPFSHTSTFQLDLVTYLLQPALLDCVDDVAGTIIST